MVHSSEILPFFEMDRYKNLTMLKQICGDSFTRKIIINQRREEDEVDRETISIYYMTKSGL